MLLMYEAQTDFPVAAEEVAGFVLRKCGLILRDKINDNFVREYCKYLVIVSHVGNSLLVLT